MSWIRTGLVLGSIISALISGAFAQSSNLAYQVANMSEDVRLLNESVSMLRLEVEELRRENEKLHALVKNYEGQADSVLARSVTTGQLEHVVAELKENDSATRTEVLTVVNKTMKELTDKVGKALKDMGGAAKKPVPIPQWHTNYPDTVIPYIVEKGDTLSSIAAAHHSKVDWIRNANKIVDVRILQLGQKLYIPVEQ